MKITNLPNNLWDLRDWVLIMDEKNEKRIQQLVHEAFNAIVKQDLDTLEPVLQELEDLKAQFPTSEKELVEWSCFTEFPIHKALDLYVGEDHVSLYYDSGYDFKACRYLYTDHTNSMLFLKILLRFSPIKITREEI